MDSQQLGDGPITDERPVGGGTQNVMVRFTRGGREYVLRRGPTHMRPRTNDVLLREIRVLSALADTAVRCPKIVAGCDDPSLLGDSVFYLMDPVDGFNSTVELPEPYVSDEGLRHEMALSAVDALATLGTVDPEAVGLSEFGKPVGFLERQVTRWLGELESYNRHEGYPGPDFPGLELVATWLQANVPGGTIPGIVHGDYHLANLMFMREKPEIAAIVDWEMCTLGDPLLDFGWLLTTWPDDAAGAQIAGAIGAAGSLPSTDELIARYAARSSRDLSAIDWYTVCAAFKLGIIIEGTNARAYAGKAPKDVGDMLHDTAVKLFTRAVSISERQQ
jgi:aminoglycoside phosphotransferase (APT) family kinase protein